LSLHRLPDHVTIEEGALLEPLSVGVHACRRAGVTLGSYVLICGAGPIGLVSLLVARSMGASKVIMTGRLPYIYDKLRKDQLITPLVGILLCTDISQDRLDFAKKLGADFILKVDGMKPIDVAKQVESLIGRQPDISIECSGAESSIQLSCLVIKN